MKITTERLIITEFDLSMAKSVHLNSLDDDTRRFLPDEVFETEEIAKDTLAFLIGVYSSGDGPLVYPVLLKDGTNIGYVQLVPSDSGYEVGYHIAKDYTRNGYATEALRAFIKYIMPEKALERLYGVCIMENFASARVLEKCGFKKEYEGIGKYQGMEKEISRYSFSLRGDM